MLSSGGISPFNIFTRLWSSEVDQVLSRFPNSLEGDETRVARSVQRAVDLGVWDNVDEFFALSMADAGNSLVGWKSKTATAVNSPTHTANQGYLFNGTNQYINTGWTPSVEAGLGSNYQLNDAHVECYCYDNLDGTDGAALFGALSVVGTDNTYLLQNDTANILGYCISRAQSNTGAVEDVFLDKTRYGVHRDNASTQELYKNGTEAASTIGASTGLTDQALLIGARQNQGGIANHINDRISHFLIGGGFNITNLKTWLDYHELLFIV